MLDGQAPFLGIEVAPVFALESPRMVCGFLKAVGAAKGREIGNFLLQRWSERRSLHRRAERIAFEARIQVVVLRGAVIDAKAGANDSLSVQRGGRPSDTHAGIEISVIRIVQNGILRAWRRVYRSDERCIERTASQAGSVKF